MNATPIFELADILDTPQGIALAGAYSSVQTSLGDVLKEVNQHLEGIKSIEFKDRLGKIVTLPVEKVQYTTSIEDRVNIFLLLGHVEIPNNLIPGTPIYRGQFRANELISVAKKAIS